MKREEKYNLIYRFFIPTHAPNTTVVTLKNGEIYNGFFDVGGFGNDEQLWKTQIYMFVPNYYSTSFRDEFQQTQKKNISYCVQIDVDDIDEVTYKTPENIIISKQIFPR